MKHLLAISATLAVFAAVSPFAIAQSGDMKGMDMDKKGMDMKGMDMEKCMAMQGVDHDKCMAMMNDKKGAKKSAKKAEGKTHKGAGTVQKIDPAGGSVTIAHGPIESMKWPAMTMTFKVKDKAMLDKVKQGEKIDFSFVQSGKDYTITRFE
jgi:Cu(I)/Ag(I) efflux system periplasmic protein CusF